jgi:tetratricopeptide (TPR) repeat protein
MMHLNVIDQLFTNCCNFVYHDCLAFALMSTSMLFKTQNLCVSKEKKYTNDRTILHMLGLVSKLGCVSDGLYLALYLYGTGRYETALTATDRVKQRVSQPHIMYFYNVDRQRYSEAVGGQSMLTKYKKAWVRDTVFHNDFTYIEELRLEQEASKNKGLPVLCLSPFGTVHMLSALCHYKLGNRSQYLQALTDLHTYLLLYNTGRYIPLHQRDLSWQILGICQHVSGDLHGALQSYQESLRQRPWHRIQTARETRMSLVTEQLQGRVHRMT